jgi:hypothetical protein
VTAYVAVKWLVPEVFSDDAVHLLDKERTLIAAELLFARCGPCAGAAISPKWISRRRRTC